MKHPLILALDIGTSSVRAALFDESASAVSRSLVKREYQFNDTEEGGSEIDASVLLGHVVDCIDRVLEKTARRKVSIDYVTISSFWHSLLGVDERGRPTTPVLSWADRRSRKYSEVLRERFDESEVHNRTGAHFHSSFWPAKLLWLRNEFPNIFRKTANWISFPDYVFSVLMDASQMPVEMRSWYGPDYDIHFSGPQQAYEFDGAMCLTSVSMASATGLFNIRESRWDKELLKAVGVAPENLSQVVQRSYHTFTLRRKYMTKWPSLKDAEWFPALGDGAADHIGSCDIGKEKASLMVGTSAAIRVAYKGEPPEEIPQGLWCYRIDRDRVIIGGALSDGGNLYQLIKQKFRLPANTDDLLRERGEANDDLIVVPFFFGERSTGYNEDASGAIIGLKPAHDGIDILRAAMEGVAFRLADIYERLNKVAKFKEIVASGGALRESPVWTQMIANVLGRDLTINETDESSLRGAVLLALESLGKIEGK